MGRVSTRPTKTRSAPTRLETRPKKTRLLPRPVCFNGYPFNPTLQYPTGTRPDPDSFFFFFEMLVCSREQFCYK